MRKEYEHSKQASTHRGHTLTENPSTKNKLLQEALQAHRG
ncbi:hypothetical protein ACP70R_041890 [Stipagrostis hirtigluma subsp. patula]